MSVIQYLAACEYSRGWDPAGILTISKLAYNQLHKFGKQFKFEFAKSVKTCIQVHRVTFIET